MNNFDIAIGCAYFIWTVALLWRVQRLEDWQRCHDLDEDLSTQVKPRA